MLEFVQVKLVTNSVYTVVRALLEEPLEILFKVSLFLLFNLVILLKYAIIKIVNSIFIK